MIADYQRVRRFSERLTETLTPEDATLQSMPDASPTKWHLAHTTWFFETFLVGRFDAEASGYTPIDPAYAVLFNSYYNSVGEQFPRAQRGLISRPTLADVMEYRRTVDAAMARLAESGALGDDADAGGIMAIGLNHEQQHQELLLTDIKHALSLNPLSPAYRPELRADSVASDLEWVAFEGGIHPIGHDGDGFAYDNEGPRHEALLQPFELANRPVTCGEYLAFMQAGGYEIATLWLAEGWANVQQHSWRAPLYWRAEPDGAVSNQGWTEFTLAGQTPIDLNAPVTHLSYFEAEAYARWAGARLPTEFEWEVACEDEMTDGRGQMTGFADVLLSGGNAIHPTGLIRGGGGTPVREAPGTKPTAHQNSGASATADHPRHPQSLIGMLGDVWEWTASPYTPYPGYKAVDGALGEYNGKFMVNQQILRGGSCATSSDHIRATYRNFFGTASRWQFSGIRLAR